MAVDLSGKFTGLIPDGGRNTDASYRARWVVVDPWTVFPNGFVHVSDGRIRNVGQGRPDSDRPVMDCGSGILFPALVNTHTHLELCALAGRIATGIGFGAWVKELIEKRALLKDTDIKAAASAGVQEMMDAGCGAAGEISTLGLTLETLRQKRLAGVWFREVLGDRPAGFEIPENPGSDNLHISLAGHSPHTTSPEMLKAVKNRCREMNAPFSIHLAESEEEMEFLSTASGPWKDFLLSRGIDPSAWGLPVESPVRHLQNLGILDPHTILVHLLHATPPDLALIRDAGSHVCICPRSNHALHGKLPDLGTMTRSGIRLCLGTDSPASVDSLSLLDEAAFVSGNFPDTAPERIFEMATLGGAAALGLNRRLGSLEPGKQAKLAYLDIQASGASDVIPALVHASTSARRSI